MTLLLVMLLLGLDGQVGSLYCPENSYIEMAKYRARNALPQVTFQAASGMDLTRQRWAFLKEKRVKTMLRSAIEQSRHLIINFTKENIQGSFYARCCTLH